MVERSIIVAVSKPAMSSLETESVTVPAVTELSRPEFEILAILVSEEIQLTTVVKSSVELSE